MTPREEADLMALAFLAKVGTDTVGPIDMEEKFAAALIYIGLQHRGLVIADIGDNGPAYRLTPKGREYISANTPAPSGKGE